MLSLKEETNIKFAERVEAMLFKTCGCSKERAMEILNLVLRRIK